MTDAELSTLLIPLAAVIAPLLAALVARVLVVPLVVFEIGLGMLLGPSGLGWVSDSPILDALSQIGLAALFFMAGNEINPSSLRGTAGRSALGWWGLSAVLALGAGFALGPSPEAAVLIAVALTGTALGTLMPILRDAGLSRTPLGKAIIRTGTVGEFAPLVAVSVFLSGRQPLAGTIVLLGFALIAVLAFWLAQRGPHDWLRRMVSLTLHTSGQFAVRFVLLILAALVVLALALGVDFLLGAFTAGMLARAVLQGGDPEELRVIEAKLDSVAFGFLVPVFFIATGVTFPLASLIADPAALALVPVFALAMLLVRGIPGWLGAGRDAPTSDRRTAALCTATTLPLVIAVTGIGTTHGVLEESLAAAMVGAAMLTVLLFPMLALLGRQKERTVQTAH
ncbi:cation:proton antiporter [Leucobacter chromiireducens]|uniref:Cation:proton antiporter n=1 Tax=Leucobacter chromiireducens subsp. chromiireducens TaxID=660067 RepID=A0ABS1SNG8_9MICO|nr:cation:proton antiporter [Leucobacter chromiireducens]MBL3688682.1 cation:proton antiporter [Leucobacter chromiireducens subsp. chromiireducens]